MHFLIISLFKYENSCKWTNRKFNLQVLQCLGKLCPKFYLRFIKRCHFLL